MFTKKSLFFRKASFLLYCGNAHCLACQAVTSNLLVTATATITLATYTIDAIYGFKFFVSGFTLWLCVCVIYFVIKYVLNAILCDC